MERRLPDSEYKDGDQLIAIGKILRAHGVRGEVHVSPLTNIPGRLKSVGEIHIEAPDGRCFRRTVERARGEGNTIIMKFDGVGTREDAEALRGAYVSIEKSNEPVLDEGSYYSHELIGMTVVDTKGNNLGVIVQIDSYPANDVLVVESNRGNFEIPAVRDFVQAVDTSTKRMIVRPPEYMSDSLDDSK